MNPVRVASFSLARDDVDANADKAGYHVLSDNSVVLSLADGVGKSASGADAATIAIEVSLSQKSARSPEEIFSLAQSEISRHAAANPGSSWSTTLTICTIIGDHAIVGHVGDSRLYHLRGSGIVTRTHDQTEAQALVDEGVISKQRARKYPRRNILVSALGNEIPYNLYKEEFELIQGDRLLLVSDGIYKQLSRREILSASLNNPKVEDFISQIKTELLSKGIVDDSTALCWEVI